jgi:hypothetical protein
MHPLSLCLACLFVVSQAELAAQVPLQAAAPKLDIELQPGGEDLSLPPERTPWRDPESGLCLPQKLGTLAMQSIHHWDGGKIGTGIRYQDSEMPLRLDIFVYPAGKTLESRDEKLAGVRAELGSVWIQVLKKEEQKRYDKPKRSGPELKALNLPPKGETLLAHVAMQMGILNSENMFQPTDVWYGVIPFGNRWIRLRVSCALGRSEELERKTQSITRAVLACIQEPGMRKEALAGMRIYRRDPLSEISRQAADFIALYASENPLFTIVVPRKVTLLLARTESFMLEARTDLQRAFFVGAVAKALDWAPGLEVSKAGCLEILAAVEATLKRHPNMQVKEISDLQAAVKAGKLEEWLRE